MDELLCRFFDEEDYVKQFRSGNLRFMSSSYYSTLESNSKSKRLPPVSNKRDMTDGMAFILNQNLSPSEKIQTYHLPDGQTLSVGSSIKNAIYTNTSFNFQYKILCLCAFSRSSVSDGSFKSLLDTMKQSLGKYYCLFIDPAAFLKAVALCAHQLINLGVAKSFRGSKVNYSYDHTKDSCIVGPFSKPISLSWQTEYRILIETFNSPDPFIFPIGNISSITIWGKTEDLYQGIWDEKGIKIPNFHQ